VNQSDATSTGPTGAGASAGAGPQAASRWRAARPWLGTAVRLVLGGVWLAAGATKVGDLPASIRAVHAYQLTPYELSAIIGGALPFVELALGVLLLAGLATRLAAAASTALLSAFIAGIASAWARGLAIDCGCFSPGGELAPGVEPTYTFEIVRTGALLGLAVFLLVQPGTRLSVDARLGIAPPTEERS
jgi:uncharacterized membrane protein YphA (DoxX/SURF4 family)